MSRSSHFETLGINLRGFVLLIRFVIHLLILRMGGTTAAVLSALSILDLLKLSGKVWHFFPKFILHYRTLGLSSLAICS